MERRLGMLDRLAGLVVGFAFVLVGMLLLLLGLTFLPVIGVVAGLPVIRMACPFICPEVAEVTADEGTFHPACLPEAA
ncbi:MAG TPA: hypothetical protein DCZ69_03275 [Syntrophobacteraceae bacterium]|nr:hypothetical protein [Syntrophobacteraceae bacterium]HBD07259.1 hypothetical protein [Syntrophobacteraceae bacterium]HBZ54212.1 hypothetical protein [Syntrophobacteraceae bacterium]